MFLLFTDDTNRTPAENVKFFVYGGLFFPADRLVDLDHEITKIRVKARYGAGDEFKFDTRSRPDGVSRDAATAAKNDVVNLCLDVGCKFIAYVVHHGIVKNIDEATLWGANHVIGRFNRYLRQGKVDDHGVCLVDRLPVKQEVRYLAEKFSHGLDLDMGGYVQLDRIKAFGSTCINASHACSAVDIVLGSFRYCINEPQNIEAARVMMQKVVEMMWHHRDGDDIHALEKGLILRPRDVIVQEYKDDYSALLDHVNDLLRGEVDRTEDRNGALCDEE